MADEETSQDERRVGTRMDRRRLRTRSALIGAGQRLFASRSIDGVTIDDIVEAADVAKGSFYNHFEDKERLADAIVELVQGDCEKEVYAANNGISDPAVRVARAVAVFLRYAQLHPDRYRSMINLSRRQADIDAPINAGVRSDVAAGLATGKFDVTSLEYGVLAVFAMISNSVEYIITTGEKCSSRAVAQEMASMLLRALGVGNDTAKAVAQAAVADIFGTPAA